MDFAFEADHRIKSKEIEKSDKYLDLARKLKIMEHESDGNTYCNKCTWNDPKSIGKGTKKRRNKWPSGDLSNYHMVNIEQNTEKSPGDLRSLVTFRLP